MKVEVIDLDAVSNRSVEVVRFAGEPGGSARSISSVGATQGTAPAGCGGCGGNGARHNTRWRADPDLSERATESPRAGAFDPGSWAASALPVALARGGELGDYEPVVPGPGARGRVYEPGGASLRPGTTLSPPETGPPEGARGYWLEWGPYDPFLTVVMSDGTESHRLADRWTRGHLTLSIDEGELSRLAPRAGTRQIERIRWRGIPRTFVDVFFDTDILWARWWSDFDGIDIEPRFIRGSPYGTFLRYTWPAIPPSDEIWEFSPFADAERLGLHDHTSRITAIRYYDQGECSGFASWRDIAEAVFPELDNAIGYAVERGGGDPPSSVFPSGNWVLTPILREDRPFVTGVPAVGLPPDDGRAAFTLFRRYAVSFAPYAGAGHVEIRLRGEFFAFGHQLHFRLEHFQVDSSGSAADYLTELLVPGVPFPPLTDPATVAVAGQISGELFLGGTRLIDLVASTVRLEIENQIVVKFNEAIPRLLGRRPLDAGPMGEVQTLACRNQENCLENLQFGLVISYSERGLDPRDGAAAAAGLRLPNAACLPSAYAESGRECLVVPNVHHLLARPEGIEIVIAGRDRPDRLRPLLPRSACLLGPPECTVDGGYLGGIFETVRRRPWGDPGPA